MESSGEREKKSEKRRKMENKIVARFIFCYFALKNMKQTISVSNKTSMIIVGNFETNLKKSNRTGTHNRMTTLYVLCVFEM